MSVLIANRKTSKVEFVYTARELLVITLHNTKKLPKSITFYLTQDIVKYARDTYTLVFRANEIYLNQENYGMRRRYLQEALNSLNAYQSLISILFDVYHSCLTDCTWRSIGELINKEHNLIKAVIESDSKRLPTDKLALQL